jgi:hypothetical protein
LPRIGHGFGPGGSRGVFDRKVDLICLRKRRRRGERRIEKMI